MQETPMKSKPSRVFQRIQATFIAHSEASKLKRCELTLHIGFLKTGSTYLQQQLACSSTDLSLEGLLIPNTGVKAGIAAGPRAGKTSGHAEFATMLRIKDWKRAGHLLALLANEAEQENCQRILITAENISYRRDPDRNTILRFFISRFQNVRIVAYVRRWDHWVESLYKERLSFGETRSFEQFREDEAWQLDYIHRLDAWGKLCGPKVQLRVFNYDAAIRSHRGLLGQFFYDLFPDIIQPAERETKGANPSYNSTQAEALRTFNILQRGVHMRRVEHLDAFLSGDFSTLKGPKSLFTDSERQDFLSRFQAQNDALNRLYGLDLLEGVSSRTKQDQLESP
jgi:hypothetical protein